MEKQILLDIWQALQQAVVQPGHAFRTFTLATMDTGERPQARLVVLRELLDDNRLVFYTDGRSQKVDQMLRNPQVSLLFYDRDQWIQLRIEGKARVFAEGKETLQRWQKIPEGNRHNYTTAMPPGSALDTPGHVGHLTDRNFFRVVVILPETLEYLRLEKEGAVRIQYVREAGSWHGRFIHP